MVCLIKSFVHKWNWQLYLLSDLWFLRSDKRDRFKIIVRCLNYSRNISLSKNWFWVWVDSSQFDLFFFNRLGEARLQLYWEGLRKHFFWYEEAIRPDGEIYEISPYCYTLVVQDDTMYYLSKLHLVISLIKIHPSGLNMSWCLQNWQTSEDQWQCIRCEQYEQFRLEKAWIVTWNSLCKGKITSPNFQPFASTLAIHVAWCQWQGYPATRGYAKW